MVHIGVFSAADVLGQLFGAIGGGVLKTLRARGGPIEAVMRPYLQALQDAGIQPQAHSLFLEAFSVGSGLLSAGGSSQDVEAEALAISEQLRPQALLQLATRQPRFSVSQAVIFEDGKLVAQESSGTDTMLRSAAKRPPKGRRVLVKLRPPQQPIGLDPPAIGPKTLRHAKQAGISGIILDAEHGIVFDRAETMAVAGTLGIWIIGA
ncbi:UDP-2,3-diacylglucosamine diphosphatase LpxI domain-containing protein [Caulobacter sp.]|uniref:UDP-2,3-diacylglucosamine diphosphatase LpxI domain-containing protein n=1 Tax=Caulobacter sp. TaxID=78 RepID=UPI003BADB335